MDFPSKVSLDSNFSKTVFFKSRVNIRDVSSSVKGTQQWFSFKNFKTLFWAIGIAFNALKTNFGLYYKMFICLVILQGILGSSQIY